jgi:hypothetical protein
MHKIAAWMRHWNGRGAIGHQAAIGRGISVDAEQDKRLRARWYVVPCQMRVVVATKAAAMLGTQRKRRGQGLTMFEIIAVDVHAALRCVTAVILCRE